MKPSDYRPQLSYSCGAVRRHVCKRLGVRALCVVFDVRGGLTLAGVEFFAVATPTCVFNAVVRAFKPDRWMVLAGRRARVRAKTRAGLRALRGTSTRAFEFARETSWAHNHVWRLSSSGGGNCCT